MLAKLSKTFTGSASRRNVSEAWHPHLGEIGGKSLAEILPFFPETAPRFTIALMTSERTGSEWLCEIMGNTGVLDRPSEYLNTHWMRRFVADYPDDAMAQVALAKRFGLTANGCVSIKLHPWHYDRLPEDAEFSSLFPDPCFVLLSREDHLGQAISLVRARQTEKFHSVTRQTRQPVYDTGQISAALDEVVISQARWNKFFSRNGIRPLKLSYESFTADPGAALRQIAKFTGVPMPSRFGRVKSRLGVQRDGTSQEWRERFLNEKRSLRYLDKI